MPTTQADRIIRSVSLLLWMNHHSNIQDVASHFLSVSGIINACRTPDDVQWNAQGRNKAIVLGQVGIRCRYCARLATWSRARGAVYYSATLDGLYQAAQNMAKNHLCRHCRLIPESNRGKLINLRDCKRRAAGGKKYWAEGARVLGVVQSNDGLRFKNALGSTTNAKQGK
jgi:hypothetical protein